MEDKIRANADLVVQKMGRLHEGFGYDAASVQWLDGFIERQRARDDLEPANVDGLVNTLGSYLGEVIIRVHGGKWREIDGNWAVEFSEGNCAFPFSKVAKQFENGSTDSIASFFNVIPSIFKKKF